MTITVEDVLREIESSKQYPTFVKSMTHAYGVDSTGDEAIWIYLNVDKDRANRADESDVRDLNTFNKEIKEKVFNTSTNAWPYLRVISE